MVYIMHDHSMFVAVLLWMAHWFVVRGSWHLTHLALVGYDLVVWHWALSTLTVGLFGVELVIFGQSRQVF